MSYDKVTDAFESLTKKVVKNGEQCNNRHKNSLFLYLCSTTANITFFAYGLNMVWTSPVIPKLRSNDTTVNPLGAPLTSHQISILAGLPYFGSIIAPLVLGQVCDIVGRRNVLTVTAGVTLFSYVALSFTSSLNVYYLSRLLLGLSQGLVAVVLPIFITEITETHNRGQFGCLTGVLLVIGQFYGFFVGNFFSVPIFTLLCAAPMVFCLGVMLFIVPESPYYSISKGEGTKAKRALMKLRGRRDVSGDYYEIQQTLQNNSGTKKGQWRTLFTDYVSRKALIINLVLGIFQMLSGIAFILAYAGPMFDSTGWVSGDTVGIMIGTTKLVAFYISSLIVDRLGRKRLMLFSAIGSGIIHILIGFFFYLKSADYLVVAQYPILPVILLVSFVFIYSLGLGPVTLVLINELQPSETRSLAVSIVSSLSCVTALAVTSGFPYVDDIVGHCGTFWIFGACCLLAAVYVKLALIETKGRTLLEIQEILKAK